MPTSYKRTKLACYTTNVSMSVVSNLSPLLFITFRTLYGVSYSLLGLLVLINFVTQLSIDLVFSFFSHKFNISRTVRAIPWLTVLGLAVYALWPMLYPAGAFAGLVVGTLIFSASGGLSEVLISPVIAAIPADDPDREMSKLHSVYAWGVVVIIVLGTLFLLFAGAERWPYMVLGFALIPLCAALLFASSEIPTMQTPEHTAGAISLFRSPGLWLCACGIFLGGAAECVMAQWSSSYLERALMIPKVWGDIFGVALFSLMLGLGRTLYAKMGREVTRVLIWGSAGAALCYLAAALSGVAVIGLLACALTGLCVSMLWPGSLIVASERYPSGGVFLFAVMAAGGDLGASVGPQAVGLVTDAVLASASAGELAARLSLTPEQLGMKLGMLMGMIFPLVAVVIFYLIRKGAVSKRPE